MVAGQPTASKVWALAVKELGPPAPAQWPAIRKDLLALVGDAQKLKFLDASLKEAGLGLLVAADVAFFFYIGAAGAVGVGGRAWVQWPWGGSVTWLLAH